MPTQEQLKELVEYNPDTGVFTRKKNIANIKKGTKAGCLAKSTGYLVFSVNDRLEYTHRMAFLYMTGKIPEVVDHINGNKTDNRFNNLRASDKKRNALNPNKLSSSNSSGFIGVSPAAGGKWSTWLRVNKKNVYGGFFSCPIDAALARCEMEYVCGVTNINSVGLNVNKLKKLGYLHKKAYL